MKTVKPGRYGDGAGLYLLVRGPTAKFWTFRYVRAGRMREIGLGPATGPAAVGLADARRKARDLYDTHKAGRDPLAEREAGRAMTAIEAAKVTTFAEAAADFIEAHKAGWGNAKHLQQWQNTLKDHAYPVIGALPVQAVDTNVVLKVLGPIWSTMPATAGRLRGRIEQVLDRAKALQLRDGENPARWRGHLDKLLPKLSKVSDPKHHAALPYAEIGDFMKQLRAEQGTAARALELVILTAVRSGEALGARWDEINIGEQLWVVPGERMKGGREHRVPLSARAVEILKQMPREGEQLVFHGRTPDRPLGNSTFSKQLQRMGRSGVTPHGFRSAFRVWCAEQTNYPSEVAEAALAHAVSDKVVAAYRRTDFFDRRRTLMAEWASYCGKPSVRRSADVVSIGGAR